MQLPPLSTGLSAHQPPRRPVAAAEGEAATGRLDSLPPDWVARLDDQKGPLRECTRRDRESILLTLARAHPGESFPERPLQQVHLETTRFMDEHATLPLGSTTLPLPLGAPGVKTPLREAVQAYAGHLERLRGTPEASARAVDCVRVELCNLYSNPEQVESFRSLVGRFRDPAVALAVHREASSLPPERRERLARAVESELEAPEGVVELAARHGLALRVARPGEDPARLLQEMPAGDPRALEEAAFWRGPGQSWAEALGNAPPGLWLNASKRLGEAVHDRVQRLGEPHDHWVRELGALGSRLRAWLPVERLHEYLQGDQPFDPAAVIAQTERETELAGMQGFSRPRAAIRSALQDGTLTGDLDHLMKRFELIFVQRKSGGDPDALQGALDELLSLAEPPASGVRETGQAVWVGGVRLSRRTRD